MSAAYKIPTQICEVLEQARSMRVDETTASVVHDSSSSDDEAGITNTELVLRMRSDPAAATPILYARFAPRIHRLVLRLLGSDVDRSDLVQQIFRKLIERGITLRDPEKLPSWIHAFTVHVVYSEIRRRRTRNKFMATMIHDHVRDLAREVEARDLLKHATEAIGRLPLPQRVAFTLCVVEGLTAKEAANIAGCSVVTIKRRLVRANRRFRMLMSRKTGVVLVDRR